MYMYIQYGSLHEHAALGPVLPHGRGLIRLLSPALQGLQGELGASLQASAGAAAFQLRLVRLAHRRQRGDVEHVTDAVLGNFGGALHVRHGAHLPGYCASLQQGDDKRGEVRKES